MTACHCSLTAEVAKSFRCFCQKLAKALESSPHNAGARGDGRWEMAEIVLIPDWGSLDGLMDEASALPDCPNRDLVRGVPTAVDAVPASSVIPAVRGLVHPFFAERSVVADP